MSLLKRLLGNNKMDGPVRQGEQEWKPARPPKPEFSAYERARTLGASPRRVVRIDADGEQIFNRNFTTADRMRTRRSDRWKVPETLDAPELPFFAEPASSYEYDAEPAYTPDDPPYMPGPWFLEPDAPAEEPPPLPPPSPAATAGSRIIISRACELSRLHLGTRTFNALMRGGIRTVGAMLDVSLDDLRNYKHVGAAAMAEVERTIAEINDPEGAFMLVHSIEPERPDAKPEEPDPEYPAVHLDPDLDVHTSTLSLSVRATNALLNAGIESAGRLVALDRKRLLKMRNMGTKSADEVLAKVDELIAMQSVRSM